MKDGIKNKIGMLGAFLAGAIAASVTGIYYFYGPEGRKNRRKMEIWTLKARAEILDKLEKGKDFTEKKYREIVDAVAEKYAKMKEVGKEKAERIAGRLKEDWEEVKREVEEEDEEKK